MWLGGERLEPEVLAGGGRVGGDHLQLSPTTKLEGQSLGVVGQCAGGEQGQRQRTASAEGFDERPFWIFTTSLADPVVIISAQCVLNKLLWIYCLKYVSSSFSKADGVIEHISYLGVDLQSSSSTPDHDSDLRMTLSSLILLFLSSCYTLGRAQRPIHPDYPSPRLVQKSSLGVSASRFFCNFYCLCLKICTT